MVYKAEEKLSILRLLAVKNKIINLMRNQEGCVCIKYTRGPDIKAHTAAVQELNSSPAMQKKNA